MKMIDVSTPMHKEMYLLVDDDDYDLLQKCGKWGADLKDNGVFYAIHVISGKKMYAHRLVMGSPDGIVDHIDGNGLNCQKSNLRVVNNRQNAWNKSKNRNKVSSKYKGVYPVSNGFRARIWNGEKNLNLGSYPTEEEAARAYNESAKIMFGDFSRQNEIVNLS